MTKELGYSIWQRSYYDHIIRNEKEYLQIAQYIEEKQMSLYWALCLTYKEAKHV